MIEEIVRRFEREYGVRPVVTITFGRHDPRGMIEDTEWGCDTWCVVAAAGDHRVWALSHDSVTEAVNRMMYLLAGAT